MKVAVMAALVLAVGCKGSQEKKKEQPAATPATVPADAAPAAEGSGIIPSDDAITPPPPRPASFTDAHRAAVKAIDDYVTAAAKVVSSHASDCEKSAAALAAVNASHEQAVAAAEKTLASLDAAAASYRDYMMLGARASAINVVMLTQVCSGHVGVGKAVADFAQRNGMGAGPPPAPGQGWSGARPPGVTDAQVAAIDEMAAWFGEVTAAAAKAKGDCAAIARSIQPIVAKGKAASERAKDLQKDVPSRSPADEWLGNYTVSKVDMEGFMNAMGACMSDPTIEKVFEGVK